MSSARGKVELAWRRMSAIGECSAEVFAVCSVNESDGTATPLYYAVRRGHLEAARLLIERGADVNARTKLGLPLVAAAVKGKVEFIKLLLDQGANPNSAVESETVLHIAVKGGCLDCVKATL